MSHALQRAGGKGLKHSIRESIIFSGKAFPDVKSPCHDPTPFGGLEQLEQRGVPAGNGFHDIRGHVRVKWREVTHPYHILEGLSHGVVVEYPYLVRAQFLRAHRLENTIWLYAAKTGVAFEHGVMDVVHVVRTGG